MFIHFVLFNYIKLVRAEFQIAPIVFILFFLCFIIKFPSFANATVPSNEINDVLCASSIAISITLIPVNEFRFGLNV